MMLAPKPLLDVISRRCWSRSYVVEVYHRETECSPSSAWRAVQRLYDHPELTIQQADRWCLILGTDLATEYPIVYATDGACR